MKDIFKTLILLSITLITTNCTTYTVTKYRATANTTEMIRMILGDKTISIGRFKGLGNELQYRCLRAGPLEVPGNQTLRDYIRNAFIEEFKMAGNYSENSNPLFSAEITHLYCDPRAGYWHININIMSENGNKFSIITTYEFSSGFFVETVCRETAHAFDKAVKNLVYQVVSNPRFKSLVAN